MRAHLDRRRAGLMALAGLLWPAVARANLAPPSLAQALPPANLAAPSLAQPLPPAASGPVDIGAFTDFYRRMTAPVWINGQGPFPFVVDTGANRSVISNELAAQLALPVGPAQPVNEAAGVALTPTANAMLGVGRRMERDLVLLVMPQVTIGGLGMLGLDRLSDQRLTLDFHAQALRIEGGRSLASDPLDIVVQARRRSGQLTLVDADMDGASVTAFLDSGSQATIGNPALRALARARTPLSSWTTASIISATGQAIPAEVATLPKLRVGGLMMRRLLVAFADLHTFHLWDLAERPAIILGVDVLRRFDSVELDFAGGEVRFRLPASA